MTNRRRPLNSVQTLCLYLFLFICLSIVSACQSTAETEEPDKWQTYVNHRVGFTIDHPSNWKVSTNARGGDEHDIVVISTPSTLTSRAVVEIAHQTMNSPVIEDVVMWGERRIRERYGAYEAGDLQNVDALTKVTARSRSYDVSARTRIKEVYIVNGNDAFVITAGTVESQYDKYSTEFEQIIASFTLTNE